MRITHDLENALHDIFPSSDFLPRIDRASSSAKPRNAEAFLAQNYASIHQIPPQLDQILSDPFHSFSFTYNNQKEVFDGTQKTKKNDACRTRTCAPEGNRFLVYRYNHSAKAPGCRSEILPNPEDSATWMMGRTTVEYMYFADWESKRDLLAPTCLVWDAWHIFGRLRRTGECLSRLMTRKTEDEMCVVCAHAEC